MSIEPQATDRSRRWTRSYPPLLLLAGAILVAVLILPSTLNLPQSNPTTVLEYAPVPPTDKTNPPAQNGNLSSLGLGSSNTLTEAAPPPPPPPPPSNNGIGTTPTQFQCVGDPPRQTFDPMSPPCVPYFKGDNFGSTYQGVTKDQITVVAYWDAAGYGPVNDLEESPQPGTWVDIDAPPLPPCPPGTATYSDPKQCDFTETRLAKAFSHYFNTRYQTYGRHVHFWEYFTSPTQTAAGRRGDAVAIWEKMHPYAVLDEASFGGFNTDFETAMAQLSVTVFGSTIGSQPNSFYRKNAPFAWGFWPDIEHQARSYATYVCQKVAPYPVKNFGNPPSSAAPNGQKRRFGMFYPDDPRKPELKYESDLIKQQIAACGVHPVMAAYTSEGYAVDSQDTSTDAEQAVARFRGTTGSNVTTVLYIGTENRFSSAADAAHYYPEIVVAGDLNNDNNFIGSVEDQNVWRNAWVDSFQVRTDRGTDSPGYRAYKEGNPNGDQNAGTDAPNRYRDFFFLFEAIQVAGPRLTPQSVDQGFHAIPEKPSTSPYEAAFFFDAGDYTSVKDAQEEWWDPSGRTRGSASPGCWRMINQGKRYLSGKWSGGDESFDSPSDPCNAYGGSIQTE
jgi:hypothetical protein